MGAGSAARKRSRRTKRQYAVAKYIGLHYIGPMNETPFTRDPAYLILAALSGEDLHGYGIMKEVERLSLGRAQLALGTLYGAIDRLLKKGLVEVAREEHQGRRLRRFYRITDQGVDDLRREAELHARVVKVAQEGLRARKPMTATFEKTC